jgi:hypothetical protein
MMAKEAVMDSHGMPPLQTRKPSVSLSYRVESLDRKMMHILNANESLWQEKDIYPVTAMVIDGTGKSFGFEVDPRPKNIQ